MAVAQTHYCGRCGAQLLPGAVFCGRCGAPQQPAAVAAPPVASPAAYGYRVAQPGAFPGLGRVKMPQPMVIGGIVAILVIATAAISIFAMVRGIGTHSTCTTNCGPKLATPLPESNTFRSITFNYEVDYSSAWKVRSQDASGISFGTRIGTINIAGSSSGDSLSQLIQHTVSALPSSSWQGVSKVSDLKGAHIGDQNGQGAIYSANLITSGGTSTKIRFAVIAATRGDVSVVIFAADPADTKNFPNGMSEGQAFDYLLQEFRWG
jgi:hypothetical protein